MTDREPDKMSEQELDRILGDLAHEYRRPPETPSDRIWRQVEHRIGDGVGDGVVGDSVDVEPGATARGRRAAERRPGRLEQWLFPQGRPVWMPWGWTTSAVALAAAAAVIFLVVQTPPREEAPISDLQERVREQAGHESASTTAFALAAGSYLGRADALLTKVAQVRESGRPAPEIQSWAESLLLETRLLLDSPAAEDPSLASLLLDLELTLAQVSQDPTQDYADAGTKESDRALLMRVRFKTPVLTLSVGI